MHVEWKTMNELNMSKKKKFVTTKYYEWMENKY